MGVEMLVYRPVAWTTQALFATMRWRMRTSGADHIPRSGAVILATNHVSHIDPLILGMAAWARGRRLSFLAKRELFDNPVIGALLRRSGQIEVDRGAARPPRWSPGWRAWPRARRSRSSPRARSARRSCRRPRGWAWRAWHWRPGCPWCPAPRA